MNGLQTPGTNEKFDWPPKDPVLPHLHGRSIYEHNSAGTGIDLPLPLLEDYLDHNATNLPGVSVTALSTSSASFDEEAADFLQQFTNEGGKIENYQEVLYFLQKNGFLIDELKYAISQINALLKTHHKYQLKLVVHTDLEQSSLRTLFLLISSRFSPKEAVGILQFLDEKLLSIMNDITKFNLDIEFTD